MSIPEITEGNIHFQTAVTQALLGPMNLRNSDFKSISGMAPQATPNTEMNFQEIPNINYPKKINFFFEKWKGQIDF